MKNNSFRIVKIRTWMLKDVLMENFPTELENILTFAVKSKNS